jgi:hypothetical protein
MVIFIGKELAIKRSDMNEEDGYVLKLVAMAVLISV